MRSHNLEIASPCHESWEAMQGAGARRFCGVCQKDVHDLSAMAQAEAQALLDEHGGASLCVRYTAESDGTLRFRDLVPRASLTRKIVRAAFAASMLAACTPYGEGPAIQDLGSSILESIRADTVPTADGGCDYTTGPFTTFHLPPGHAFCNDTGDVSPVARETAVADTPVLPPAPPVVEPVPRVDPDSLPPEMGQVVARPEPVEPLVPCDRGFAPPPAADPEPRPLPMKGRIKALPRRPKDPPKRKHTMGVMMPVDDDL
jgi:hypothetical protein